MRFNFFLLLSLYLFISSCNRHENNESQSINPEYEKAHNFDSLNIQDSAYIYYGEALELFKQKKDNYGQAKCLVNMAKILDDKGNYFKGLNFSLNAKNLFDINNKNQYYHISSNYNNLGNICNNLKKYKEAIDYYKLAAKYADDEISRLIFLANIAKTYKEEKKYTQAIKIYDSILPKAKKTNELAYARILSNLSYIKWLNDKNYNLENLQFQALELQKKTHPDKMGQNASYSHLADYFKNKDPEKALLYANQMYKIANDINSSDDKIESLQKITQLDSKNYLKNFNQYISLRDSVQTARNIDNDKFATIVYGVEETKTQNAENKAQILKQYFVLAFLAILIIIISVLFRKRQIRLKQEKELEVKNTQLKMSKKVHDVVANGLYHMMIDVQNNPEMDKTRILNDIEKMYEESRDISHENIAEKDFALRFINMINSYNSDEQKVVPVKYKENIWDNIPYNTQLELYYVLREILVNMKKHSHAKLASVKFEKDNNNLIIKYTDNGVGIDNLNEQKGTGIHNTVFRIENVGGHITFEKNPIGGLIIQITIPIN